MFKENFAGGEASGAYQKEVREDQGRRLTGSQASGELLFLEPVLKENIWGGNRLVTEFPYVSQSTNIGECWGISAHPHGDCRIREGRFAGMALSRLYEEHRELFGNITAKQFPLLVKIIDARDKLSIQVHPDDTYAAIHENGSLGKNECWYIMDCPENTSLIIGHNARTKEELVSMIEAGSYDKLLRYVPVKKGDFVSIEPGTVHSVTEGVMLLEIQQSSDITYRVYDYGRLTDGRPRPLHVARSMDVINVPDRTGEKGIVHTQEFPTDRLNLLTQCKYYKVWKLSLKSRIAFEQEYPFLLVSVLKGEGTINDRQVSKGTHLIIPSGFGQVEMQGDMEVILSTQTIYHG
ncbi:MAG: class I mannose-6-phosphate isomerase [Roseburia sp.]|nr:class I mannose-6-phosphate isomerase [Roseburia sp.]